MKLSRKWLVPQIEPEGRVGKWLTRVGAAKMLVQRSGVVANKATMWGAVTAAWNTGPELRAFFLHSYALYLAAFAVALGAYMLIDHVGIIGGEQKYTQEQAHTAERSPLKRDTEAILDTLDDTDD